MAGESIDRVVLELEARAGKFRVDMEGSASTSEKALARIENSATKMERQVGRSFAAAAQQSRLLGYQISDIGVQLSAGTSPFIVIAQQAPQVANALEGARGAVGRFATFLSGPYGAAVLAATSIVGVWLTKTDEAANTVDDLVEKMKAQARQSELNDEATELFGRTLEGVKKATEDAEKAIESLRLVQKGQAAQTAENIQQSLKDAEATRDTTRAKLEQALAILELEKAQANSTFANADEAVAQQRLLDQRIASVKALQGELAKAEDYANRQRRALDQAISARTVEEENASAAEKINRKYDAQIDRAARAANASKASQAELRKEIQAINAAREAELKRYQDSQRAARSNSSASASDARVGDMTALIKQLFPQARITSTTGGKHTKGSDHYAGRAIDFVVPGMMNEAGTQLVRQMLQAAGVEIRRNARGTEQFFGPGRGARTANDHNDHFHVAWKGNPSPDGAQRAADSEERRRQSFENELAAAMAEELAARRSLITSAEEIDKVNLASIEIERQRYNDNLDSLVSQRKLRSDEADTLRAINDETAKSRAELIQRNAQIREFRLAEAQRSRDAQLGSAQRQDEAEVLRQRSDLARTLDERNEIARRLVDLQYQEEKAQNDFVIAAAERLRLEVAAGRASQEALDAAVDAAKIAKLRNASIGERKGNDLEGINRNNPLGRYIEDIGDTKARVEEAVVRELQAVNDGITDALSSALGVKNQFVKDLFSIFLDQVIFQPLAKALQDGGGLFEGGGLGGIFGSLFGSIFGGIFGRASGGYNAPHSITRVNEHAGGVELLRMGSQGGTVIPIGQANARAAGGGGQTIVNQTFVLDARHGITTPQLIEYVNQTAQSAAVQMGGAVGRSVLKAMPGRLASYQRDGT